MNRITRYISILLLVSFLPILTPREFIHDLFGHEDTFDAYHSALVIERVHTHCSILQVTFSTFISTLKVFSVKKEVSNCPYAFSRTLFIPAISVHLSSLRAPPLYYS
jgi:hypothetical protein